MSKIFFSVVFFIMNTLYICIREQESIYEKRMQTLENTVNDLHSEIKFENRVKDKDNFFIKLKCYLTLHNMGFNLLAGGCK